MGHFHLKMHYLWLQMRHPYGINTLTGMTRGENNKYSNNGGAHTWFTGVCALD